MTLNDAQKQQVTTWLQQGAKLAEVQKRLETEFGLRLTYMEVKLIVSDLQVLPKDIEPAKPAPSPVLPPTSAPPSPAAEAPLDDATPAPLAGEVRVSVDRLARPGAMVSGNVTFSDGKGASWYIDQMGRIGVAPKEKGYRPSPLDMQQFQAALEQELARQGL